MVIILCSGCFGLKYVKSRLFEIFILLFVIQAVTLPENNQENVSLKK